MISFCFYFIRKVIVCFVLILLSNINNNNNNNNSNNYYHILAETIPSSSDLTSRLQVNQPQTLSVTDGYNHREALFGISPYGGSIQAKLYYAGDTLCGQSDIDKKKAYPRGETKWSSPFILMVDRGDCTFVQKVRNGQHAGAAGVLIADNTCICGDEDCMNYSNNDPTNNVIVCETQEPIMADDGSGGDITIPSFLLYKHDADKFKQVLMSDTASNAMQVEMSWSMPKPDGHVEYDLWTTPTDIVSRSFLLNWKKVAIALGNRAYFTPHMYIYDGVRAGCASSSSTNAQGSCYNLCTNGGRYCGTDPDNDLAKGTSGSDVVVESLRRLCIWNIFGAPDGIGVQWWNYVEQFALTCNTSEKFIDPKCLDEVYKKVGIDMQRVERCMIDSGKTDDNVVNNKLEAEIASQTKRGVVILPSAFVNAAPIRGALNTNNIFTAICSGFSDGTAPEVCQKCFACSDIVGCIDNKFVCKSSTAGSYYGGTSAGNMSFTRFAMSMLVLIGVLCGIAVVYYRQTQESMRREVRELLAEYMPLHDEDQPHDGHNRFLGKIPLTSMQFNHNDNNMPGGGYPPSPHHPHQQQQQFNLDGHPQLQQQQQPYDPNSTLPTASFLSTTTAQTPLGNQYI